MRLEDLAHDNIRAKAKAAGVWALVGKVVRREEDRIFFIGAPALDNWLRLVPNFRRDWFRASGPHKRIYDVFAEELEGLDEPIVSFREKARPSLQVCVVATPMGCYGDMDIDGSSPWFDLFGFVHHGLEVLWPGKTDHVKIRAQLERDENVRRYL